MCRHCQSLIIVEISAKTRQFALLLRGYLCAPSGVRAPTLKTAVLYYISEKFYCVGIYRIVSFRRSSSVQKITFYTDILTACTMIMKLAKQLLNSHGLHCQWEELWSSLHLTKSKRQFLLTDIIGLRAVGCFISLFLYLLGQ